MSRFGFVDDRSGTYGVKQLCAVLGLSRSGFYAWKKGGAARAERAARDAELTAAIRRIHDQDPAYGEPRITAELREQGHDVNHERVERLMRAAGIEELHPRTKVRTTACEPSDQPVPDLVGRDFTAERPNSRYVGDITYLPVEGGRFLYLATVIDLYSRRLVGWSIADHMRTELVADALEAARAERGCVAGALFHSDQYTSAAFARVCGRLGVVQSMGAVGSSADNAAAESFNASLKRETLEGKGLKRWANTRLGDGEADIRTQVVTLGWKTVTTTPKSAAGQRTITLDKDTVRGLRSWRRFQNEARLAAGRGWVDSGLVFTRKDGSGWHPGEVTRWFNRVVRAVGLSPIHLHGLRHGAASLALAAGADVKVVSGELGHATTHFTQDTYQTVFPEVARAVAEATAALLKPVSR